MKNTLLIITLLAGIALFGQVDSTQTHSVDTLEKKEHKIKKGFSFGALPVVAYDSDVGFKYGALTNIYYFGDGSTYPKYLHSLFLE